MNRRIGLLVVLLGFLQNAFSQTANLDSIYNTNSPMFPTAERIAYYEQLYRFRVNRFVDLNEKQNKGFNSTKAPIGDLILTMVKQNKLKPFGSAVGDPAEFDDPMADSSALVLNSNYSRSETRGKWTATDSYQAGEKVIVTETDDKGVTDDIVYSALQDNTGKDPQTSDSFWAKQGSMEQKLDKSDIVGIDIVEDVIFDKRKSRLTYDILAIGLCIVNSAGELQTRFYVRYADLAKEIERLSKSPVRSERNRVMWQNRYNPSENKKFTDALKLRLFHGIIRKVENPDDKDIMSTIYDKNAGKGSYAEGVFAMWEQDMQMMEKEHNLWEY